MNAISYRAASHDHDDNRAASIDSDGEAQEARGPRYELLAQLGTGGMATVHLARRVDADGSARPVAVKRLHDFIADDPQNVAILLDEARLAASIRHPNVVGVIDLVEGVDGGAPSMIMEWIEGSSLAAINTAVEKTGARLPIDVTVAIMCDVLAGLDAAHEAQNGDRPLEIVHRDVSPQNVLVGLDGRARITDFGVAKAAWRLQQTDGSAIKGKLGYMAPEQLEGRGDRRADIYGAAAVLWELLTGQRLRNADGHGAQILVQILYGLVTPPSLHEPSAAVLDDLVMRGLRRHPEDRYATAREMGSMLAAVIAPASHERVAEVLKELLDEPSVLSGSSVPCSSVIPVSEAAPASEAPVSRTRERRSARSAPHACRPSLRPSSRATRSRRVSRRAA